MPSVARVGEANGRVYDPLMAQFLSPDPYIQAPGSWMNYNRYAYCLNNPLMYTDPSGYKWNWNWLNPVHWLSQGMQWINDNTTGLRQTMTDIGVPAFNVGYNTSDGSFHSFGNGANIYHNQFDPAVNANRSINEVRLAEGVVNYNPSGQGVTPFDVGVEWLTGTGPRHRNFTNGDVFTEMLRQHDHVLATKASIPGMIANGKMRGNAPYSLSGVQGVGKYVKDYSTLATGGLTGNLAVTYLGSYNLGWQVTAVNGNSATVQFLVNNSSTIQSATRPPVLGYYSWWQNSVGSWINSSFSSGPMSPTTQTFRWTETVTW